MKKRSMIIALIVFIFDQFIKVIINKSFYYGKTVPIIPNFFNVTKVYNDGAAWSLFQGGIYFLIIVGILAFVLILIYQKNFKENKRNTLAFGLVYGGLFGNLVDRIFYGYVIDYLKFNFGYYEFPVFNLADICLVVGSALIILAIYKGDDKSGDKSKRK